MVSCLRCGKTLPYDCTCEEDPSKRLDKYLSQGRREIKLLKAMLKGFKPMVHLESISLDGKKREVSVIEQVAKIDDFMFELVFEETIPETSDIVLTLFDARNKPLYKRTGFYRKDDKLHIVWCLGIPREE